jgi:hypothetical protein
MAGGNERETALNDYPFAGTWHMVHDNWVGTLTIAVSDRVFTRSAPPCTFSFRRVNGTYVAAAGGAPLTVVGRVGGMDRQQVGHDCPQSDHKITFTVAFPGADPQRFQGYFFTQAGPAQMAGLTWWQGLPFGWLAARM